MRKYLIGTALIYWIYKEYRHWKSYLKIEDEVKQKKLVISDLENTPVPTNLFQYDQILEFVSNEQYDINHVFGHSIYDKNLSNLTDNQIKKLFASLICPSNMDLAMTMKEAYLDEIVGKIRKRYPNVV